MGVIVILGTNVSGWDTVFYDGVRIYNLVLRDHFLKNLHVRCIAYPFEKSFRKVTLWKGNRAVISFICNTKKNLHLYHHVDVFYNISIEKKIKSI